MTDAAREALELKAAFHQRLAQAHWLAAKASASPANRNYQTACSAWQAGLARRALWLLLAGGEAHD